jgi:actin cytoskeleton-regulatory complex protein SLA1
MATALYDYEPQTDEEIVIREGDLLRIYEKVDDDWWFVKRDNDVGLVPASYVEEQSEQPVKSVPPPQSDASEQKHMLMNALGGFGFERKKSDARVPSGILYGPDDITYYTVLDIDKKKKKNSQKGLMGVSQVEQLIYFLEPQVSHFDIDTRDTLLDSCKGPKETQGEKDQNSSRMGWGVKRV